MNKEISKMLTTKEVAELLNISASYVVKLIKAKKIPGVRIFGDWRTPKEGLMEIINRELLNQECR